nr:DUF4011 domain-containing protein [Ornithinimicrobium sp. F0845]
MWHRDLPTGTIDLTVAHPGGVAKLLAGHNTLLSELVRESVALTEVRRRVAAIRAKAVELQREHGMSTLFLAVGMASWHLPRAPIPPRAPVLLRGARIRPTDASRRDYVLRLDADVIFNPALEHYLRGERGVELDGHALARASTGRQGFDPRPTYDALEELCAGIPQFGIGPQLVLSTYPLAKLPLVAELSGPLERWTARPLLVSLAGGAAPPQEDSPQAEATDGPAPDGRLSLVLEADRAQREVLGLLAAKQSVVLDAVPGTGRTQTIVNAIAQTVIGGGSVLVAAEQRRALEGVHERLRSIGLGDLVLDIRETAAGARRAAAELIDALDRHQSGERDAHPASTDPESFGDPLAVLRAHDEHLHGRREPWGVSLAQTHDVLTRLAKLPHPPTSHVRLEAEVLKDLTPTAIGEVRDALTRAVTAGAWKRRLEDPWFGALVTNPEEAERAASIVSELVSGRFTEARDDVTRIARAAGLPAPANLQQWTRTFELLRRVRDTLDVFTPQVYEAPLDELVRGTARQPRGSQDKLPAMSRSRLRRQARALLRPGTPPPDLGDRLAAARDERAEWEGLAGRAARPSTPRGWEEAAEQYAEMHRELSWLAGVLVTTAQGKDLETTHLDLLLERLVRLDARADRLAVVAAVHSDLQPLRDRGLGRLVDDLAARGVAVEHVEAEADLVFWASVHDQITQRGAHADGAALRQAADDLVAQEEARIERARAAVRAAAHDQVEAALSGHPTQEAALRAVVDAGPPLRLIDLIAAAPDLVRALRPCWLASPLTIPATIPQDAEVDLVVIDEAHRLPIARAVPALARADRALIVGDSGGLPGLPFVSVVDEHVRPAEADGQDLLAAASVHLPVRHLDTHYRSLDQRMVPRQVTRPLAGYPGVLLAPRVTALEADGRDDLVAAVVERVVDHARRTPQHSLAVLVDDGHLVADLEEGLWARVGVEADLAGSFREDVAEPFLVSTVEHAAGDVRDRLLVVLSGRSGLDESWAVAALGSARRSVVVVADRPFADLPDSGGIAVIRATLEAAAVPPDAHLAPAGEGGPADDADTPDDGDRSDSTDTSESADRLALPVDGRSGGTALLEDLAARLRAEDLTVRVGFGTGPHRIELVVDDPGEPGRPLLAIDTDTWPEPGDAGSRELEPGVLDPARLRNRSLHLRRLGWTPLRVWTTDVFRDPAREVARIVELARRASAERGR